MAASNPAKLEKALATIANVFVLNQNNPSGVSTVAVNSPATNSTSMGSTNFATGSSSNSRLSSRR